MKKIFKCSLALLLSVGVSLAWSAPVEKQIYYTKKTTLSFPATYTFRFTLWDAEAGGAEVWEEEKPVSLKNNLIKTYLGDTNPLDDVDFSQQYWVQVERRRGDGTYVGIGTRDLFSVAPYALWSQTSGESVIPGSHTHPAEDIVSGSLDQALSSAYGDLSAEGYLDNNVDTDLLTRGQSDSRYVNEGQVDSITSAMILDGILSLADIGQNGCTDDQIIKWNGSAWICANMGSGSHTHSASDITTDVLDHARFSSYADLSAEGYLDNHADTDLLIRGQSDSRYVNEGQVDSITSTMILDGTLSLADIGQNGCTNDQIIKWNGSAWICANMGSGSHTHSAGDITTDVLDHARFSSYADLSAEGYLDNNADTDLLTRGQSDSRYVNEGQANSITSAMILDGTLSLADIGQNGCTNGQIIKWNGSAWACVDIGSLPHTHSAGDITAGTLGNAFFSAYSDLGAEGYLDNSAGTDLLTRSQADDRYVNEGQTGGIGTTMIQTGAVTDEKITGPISASKIGFGGLNADTLDGLDSTGFALTGHAHSNSVDLTSNQTIDGTKTFSNPVVSTVSTGTPPLQVASTSLVINLNSERVGGYALADLDSRYGQASLPQYPRTNTISFVDSGGFAGLYTSMTIGNDGLPVISYYDATNGNLKVAKCGNGVCSAGNMITTVDSAGQVGTYTSIMIGTDGLPLISYDDVTNGDLKVLKCSTASCSGSNVITTVDAAGDVGTYSSLTIGFDGLPVISYYDVGNGNLKAVKCGDPFCASANTFTTLDSTGDVGLHTSVAIGTDGLPVMSYYDATGANLKALKCGNPSCSSGNTITALDSTGDVGPYTSITLGTDSFPLISYYDVTNANLKVVKCGNAACSAGNTITALDSVGDVGSHTSITIGLDGLPIISYYDGTNFDLKVIKCGNAACTLGNVIANVDSGGFAGTHTSITIGTDGLPVISYYDGSNGDLKFAKCANSFCLNNWSKR